MKQQRSENGFTLVEMAIAMIIIGLLIAFASVGFSALLKRDLDRKTKENLEVIADAIAVYAQKNMRVPCPADPTGSGTEPFGTEVGSGANGDNFGSCDINTAEGIIPYATLGLPQRFIRDLYGHYYTYRVSVTSALRPANTVAAQINNWCMTSPYWHRDTDGDGASDTYVSLSKAAFCCGTWDNTGDIDIQGSFGPLPNLSRQIDGEGGNVIEYRTSAAAPPTEAELNNVLGVSSVTPIFPAYIIVSHGENGDGAFTSSGARATAGMTTAEAENADGDITFFAPDRMATNPTAAGEQSLFRPDIDDIVFWQTPFQVLGRVGGVSCSSP